VRERKCPIGPTKVDAESELTGRTQLGPPVRVGTNVHIRRLVIEGQQLIVGLVLTREVLFVFLIAFCVLLALWPFGFVAFHVAGGLIHLLLVIAVISLIVHFTRAHGLNTVLELFGE